jgi:hypothetical protein
MATSLSPSSRETHRGVYNDRKDSERGERVAKGTSMRKEKKKPKKK